jgi:hypothetical protein
MDQDQARGAVNEPGKKSRGANPAAETMMTQMTEVLTLKNRPTYARR